MSWAGDAVHRALEDAEAERRGTRCGCKQADAAVKRHLRAQLPPERAKRAIEQLSGACCPSCCSCWYDRISDDLVYYAGVKA